MTDLRTAAQQALEALRSATPADSAQAREQLAALAALRAALAQQVEPLINQCGETCERAKLCAVCASKLAEPVQMPAQEPYCHVYEYDSVFGLHRELYPREYNGRKPDRAVPLYTTPPQRTMVPLTEEEIDRIGMTHQSLRQVVRAVEKAVWEKNHAKGL